MSLIRKSKVAKDFALGNITVVRVVSADENEMVLQNGRTLRILDSWRNNLKFIRPITDPYTNEIIEKPRYKDGGRIGMGVFLIMRKGEFTGIVMDYSEESAPVDGAGFICITTGRTHTVRIRDMYSNRGPDTLAKHGMGTDFAAEAELNFRL